MFKGYYRAEDLTKDVLGELACVGCGEGGHLKGAPMMPPELRMHPCALLRHHQIRSDQIRRAGRQGVGDLGMFSRCSCYRGGGGGHMLRYVFQLEVLSWCSCDRLEVLTACSCAPYCYSHKKQGRAWARKAASAHLLRTWPRAAGDA